MDPVGMLLKFFGSYTLVMMFVGHMTEAYFEVLERKYICDPNELAEYEKNYQKNERGIEQSLKNNK